MQPKTIILSTLFSLNSILFITNQPDNFYQATALSQPVYQSIPELEDIDKFRETFEARYVPSGDMEPTIQVNDKVLIDKHTYKLEEPERGDIVIFNPPETLIRQNFRDSFIKRIIGLPGETVEIKAGQVYINTLPLQEGYIAEPPLYEYGPVQIPANSYFVLGDNRNNSYDSHYWGFVPRSLIFGKAIAIYCPVERQQILDTSVPLSPKNQAIISTIQEIFRSSPSLCNLSP
ncbi:MAG TPA: signal peptidase I [Cyanobacteria bacterium UBA12227]|nr:signal peptidase I [Cyanobacteria bacterium UBA12227]HAX86062.1 signal peptidase I [Cyanobacteria bacterium UBA11370]HBY79181.1 signal peptidase I [Cyanobacteria bacterium UBA11148]